MEMQPVSHKIDTGVLHSSGISPDSPAGRGEAQPLPMDFTPPTIPDRMFFKIGDVADLVGVKPYVLRYWETEFPILSPDKGTNGQRIYRRSDVEMLLLIKHLLYKERYSIEGARNRIRELRREGELKQFQRQQVLGGEQTVRSQEVLRDVAACVKELADLSRTPIHEIFKC